MTAILIIVGAITLSCALRTSKISLFRKFGILGFLATTYLIGYYAAGRIVWVGLGLVSLWFIFPWVELVTRTRKMRLPVERDLKKQTPPGSGRFPELSSMTQEIENEGFEYLSDTGWEWEGSSQFLRFFYHKERKLQASICFTEQDNFSWASVNLTSRHEDDRIFRSINVPFSVPMKTAPNVSIRRDMVSTNFDDYLLAHDGWLLTHGILDTHLTPQENIDLLEQAAEESGAQIDHNVASGIISLCEEDKKWRYSWRGLMYLYFQVVKNFLRWC